MLLKIKVLVLFTCLSFLLSCSVMHKSRQKAPVQTSVVEKPQTVPEVRKPEEQPIVEVKEKLVEVKNVPVDPHTYFVIIGSFRNPNNAKKYQELVAADGFISVLLQNEAGLYRVSVKSGDDISAAREEIKRIRTQFKQYEDTWLLIRIK